MVIISNIPITAEIAQIALTTFASVEFEMFAEQQGEQQHIINSEY